MKKSLISLVGLSIAIAAITAAAFALASDRSGDNDLDAANEWELVEVSGWPGGFSLRLPPGWQLNELQGIDSYVGEIVGGGARLTFDFGWYSSSLVDDDDPPYIVTYEVIGGRRAKLVRPRIQGEELITGVYFENIDSSDLDIPSQNRLQISGVGLTPDQQEAALAVFLTIRSLASDLQPIEDFRYGPCEMTAIGYVGPIEALRGIDRFPTGFDPVNGGACTFSRPIASIDLDLFRDGERVFSQTITLDSPSEVVRFPLSRDLVTVVPADIEPGRYERRVRAASIDGETAVMVSDSIWVFDPAGHPATAARHALAERLGVGFHLTYLLTYEPVTWGDSSLDCPEPGGSYDQVETPGFRLVVSVNTPELWEQRYEYHTNLDGSMIVACAEPDGVASRPQVGLPDESPASDDSHASLLEDLRTVGVAAEDVAGPLTQYSFSVGGKRVAVNGGTIHVFDFPDAAGADTEASFVSSNGSTIAVPLEGGVIKESLYEWVETPHFYQKASLIVVYIGDDGDVIDALVKVLGPQFAGGQAVSTSATNKPPPSATREWNLEGIQVDGSTVTVLLYVFAGIDVRVTLDGRSPDETTTSVPILDFVFKNVAPGKHNIEVKDVVGFTEAADVVIRTQTPEIADWLARLIQRLENEPVANPPASITRFEYKGQTVYFIPQRCCDIFSDLYDSDGNIIGHPDGGITGQGYGRVPNFFEDRNNELAIWKDKRMYDPGLGQVTAPIESVEVLIMESFPVQYSVAVVSGLPNACVSFGGYRLERDGNAIQVEIVNWKPTDPEVVCPATYNIVD